MKKRNLSLSLLLLWSFIYQKNKGTPLAKIRPLLYSQYSFVHPKVYTSHINRLMSSLMIVNLHWKKNKNKNLLFLPIVLVMISLQSKREWMREGIKSITCWKNSSMIMLTFDRWTSHCLYDEHKSAAVILTPKIRSLEISRA